MSVLLEIADGKKWWLAPVPLAPVPLPRLRRVCRWGVVAAGAIHEKMTTGVNLHCNKSNAEKPCGTSLEPRRWQALRARTCRCLSEKSAIETAK
jgi:hypothetical protein